MHGTNENAAQIAGEAGTGGNVPLASTGWYVVTKKRSFGRKGEIICTCKYVSDIYVSLYRLGIDPLDVKIERQN